MSETAQDALDPIFTGATGGTRRQAVALGCDCGLTFRAEVHAGLDVAADPDLVDLLRQGELDAVRCPRCGQLHRPTVARTVHHPTRRLFALLLSPSLRHMELQLRAELMQQLAAETADVPCYVKEPRVVYGASGLAAWLTSGPELPAPDARWLHARQTELERREEDLQAREEDLLQREEDLVNNREVFERRAQVLEQRATEVERERAALRALAVDLSVRERALQERTETYWPPTEAGEVNEAEERPQDEIDRWRASENQVGAFLHQEHVVLVARPGTELRRLHGVPPRMLVQLHRLPAGPVVVLAALATAAEEPAEDSGEPAAGGSGTEPTRVMAAEELAAVQESASTAACPEGPALFWVFAPADGKERELLERLAQRFEVQLDVYDEESRRSTTWIVREPLEENVAYVLREADRALADADPAALDFEAAAAQFAELGESRLGRKQHNFSRDSFAVLPSPAAARLALGIVSYWSEPANEDYLLTRKSFPVEFWRQIRARVVRRALDFGLCLDDRLAELAEEQGAVESRHQLLRLALANFAEVSLRLKPSDLSPVQEWDNWRQLLARCASHGVPVESEIEELAAASARRARDVAQPLEDETAPGGDLGRLSVDQLLPLLSLRAHRRDAALELCERGAPEVADPVFAALRNMTRDEVARVMPALISLGEEIVPLLLQGLKHRKSFLRQGCALALGALRATPAVRPLVELLLKEPMRIWMETARAIGDLGDAVLPDLIRAVGRADGEERERLAWAMAHVALREEGLAQVQRLAAREEATAVGKTAQRALRMLDYVRQNDAEVRGQRPLSEHTIVRRFSRRFFDALADEAAELSDEDIIQEDGEEELAILDADILEAATVDGDAAVADDPEADAAEASDALEVDDEDIIERGTPAE